MYSSSSVTVPISNHCSAQCSVFTSVKQLGRVVLLVYHPSNDLRQSIVIFYFALGRNAKCEVTWPRPITISLSAWACSLYVRMSARISQKNPQLHCFRNIPERTAYKLTKQVCVELYTLALNVTLPAFAAERRRHYRTISPAHEALSSKPAGSRCCCRSMGQTGRQKDNQALHRPCYATTQAVPIICSSKPSIRH